MAGLALLLTVLVPGLALANSTRYVAKTGYDGGNDCHSSESPCKTITHALDVANPDDVIYVRAGVYTEDLTINKSVHIEGDGQAKTIIEGIFGQGRVILVERPWIVALEHLGIRKGLNNDVGAGIKNEGNLLLNDVTVTQNSAYGGKGGGIYNDVHAYLDVESSLISDNFAQDEGGGICNLGTLYVQKSHFKHNSTHNRTGLGGAIAIDQGGSADLFVDLIERNEAFKGGGIFVYGSRNVNLDQVTLDTNTALNMGGGIDNEKGHISLREVTLVNNSAGDNGLFGYGGGIANFVSSTLKLKDVTFDRNQARGAGGSGGGLYNYDNSAASTVLGANVTFNNNSAAHGAAIMDGVGNGGLSNVTLKNSTIVDSVSFENVIYTDFFGNASVGLTNTIIASKYGSACFGVILSGGYNLYNMNDTTCHLDSNKHDLIGANPKLGTFGNHGGHTWTFPLLSNSAAIDHGTNQGCPSSDQRFVSRPQDGDGVGGATCDIGALEYKP